MSIDVPSVILGLLIGAAVMASLSYARVGRAFARTVAIALMAAGVGLLTWGLYVVLGGESTFQPMEFGPVILVTAGQTLGWASGCIAGAIVALVLSFVGR